MASTFTDSTTAFCPTTPPVPNSHEIILGVICGCTGPDCGTQGLVINNAYNLDSNALGSSPYQCANSMCVSQPSPAGNINEI